MIKFILSSILVISTIHLISSQVIDSPAAFLGYEMGESFTYHHQVERYFQYLAKESDQLKLQYYGSTYEGRPLFTAIISSVENLEKIDLIRKQNLDMVKGKNSELLSSPIALVWLSYNIHGNEAVSTEASMLMAYTLINDTLAAQWLNRVVVIIDPCLNPDGHTRYVQFYNERKGIKPSALPFTWEHLERWPGGRPNHYLFDLNRDWAWQTQQESKMRATWMNQWMPHIHVDFHEMSIDQPYFFSPAAKPYHENVTQWQRQCQNLIGKRLSEVFDSLGWLYFTAEVFDLFYPSYGDTYPTFNGAIGMTYEKGGGGLAGLAVINASGDTLTLKERITQHHIAGLHTIEVAYAQHSRIVSEFSQYFKNAIHQPPGKYKTYIVKNKNIDQIKALRSFLKQQGIDYQISGESKVGLQGFSYQTGNKESFSLEKGDLIISAYQSKSVLLKVLFEPESVLQDSNTYDITAWAIPYAWGLNAFALESKLNIRNLEEELAMPIALPVPEIYGLVLPWKDITDAKFLQTAFDIGAKARILDQKTKLGHLEIERGSVLFLKADNSAEMLDSLFLLADTYSKSLQILKSSFPEFGPSLGSPSVRKLSNPEIGILAGTGFNRYEVGEMWHFFEQDLGKSVHLLEKEQINFSNLQRFQVLIIPSFYNTDWLSDTKIQDIKEWIKKGGRLILSESAVQHFSQKNIFGPKLRKQPEQDSLAPTLDLIPSETRKIQELESQNSGSIFKLAIDNSFPLGYGFGDIHFILKSNQVAYDLSNQIQPIGIHRVGSLTSGFVGHKLKSHIESGVSISFEKLGKGHIVYFADNPIFRSFWRSGKLFVANAAYLMN